MVTSDEMQDYLYVFSILLNNSGALYKWLCYLQIQYIFLILRKMIQKK